MANRFDPFGGLESVAGQGRSAYGFAGEEQDADSGHLFLRARTYNPETGRFLQQDSVLGDPMQPRSLHRYAYGFSNPVNYTDPSGLMPPINAAPVIGNQSAATRQAMYRHFIQNSQSYAPTAPTQVSPQARYAAQARRPGFNSTALSRPDGGIPRVQVARSVNTPDWQTYSDPVAKEQSRERGIHACGFSDIISGLSQSFLNGSIVPDVAGLMLASPPALRQTLTSFGQLNLDNILTSLVMGPAAAVVFGTSYLYHGISGVLSGAGWQVDAGQVWAKTQAGLAPMEEFVRKGIKELGAARIIAAAAIITAAVVLTGGAAIPAIAAGAALGAGFSYGSQVYSNLKAEQSWGEALTNVNGWEIARSALDDATLSAGFAIGGVALGGLAVGGKALAGAALKGVGKLGINTLVKSGLKGLGRKAGGKLLSFAVKDLGHFGGRKVAQELLFSATLGGVLNVGVGYLNRKGEYGAEQFITDFGIGVGFGATAYGIGKGFTTEFVGVRGKVWEVFFGASRVLGLAQLNVFEGAITAYSRGEDFGTYDIGNAFLAGGIGGSVGEFGNIITNRAVNKKLSEFSNSRIITKNSRREWDNILRDYEADARSKISPRKNATPLGEVGYPEHLVDQAILGREMLKDIANKVSISPPHPGKSIRRIQETAFLFITALSDAETYPPIVTDETQ